MKAAEAMITGAVDIGGTKIAVGAIDGAGRLLAREETPTAAARGFEDAMERVAGMLGRVRTQLDRPMQGVGIGCTGPVDPVRGTIGNVDFLPGWKGANPVATLSARLGLPVAMENDADAAALAEAAWGAGRGRKSLIGVTVGTGIGAGILLNGAIYRGVDGAHPEIGHHVIDDTGPACTCGARGCWEALASGPAIAARYARAAAVAAGSPRPEVSTQQICALARAGDALALEEVARAGRYLGIGIANLVTLFVPELIVLSGSVMNSIELFLPAIRAVIGRQCNLVPADRVELMPSSLRADAPLIGAAVVWTHRHAAEGGR
jgi:glucokinase